MSLFDVQVGSAQGPFKWFSVEIRFDRPLDARELRRLERLRLEYGQPSDFHVGNDGVVVEQWPSKWPGAADEERIRQAVAGLPAPRIRLAPFGAGCEAVCAAECAAELGSPHACTPNLQLAAWTALE